MFNNRYSAKKVIVTGHTGFKGRWLSTWLLSLGADVSGISTGSSDAVSFFDDLPRNASFKTVKADILDLGHLKTVINEVQPDFLFHLAAQPIVGASYVEPVGTLRTNCIGTANILEALRQSNHPCAAIIATSDKYVDWENDEKAGSQTKNPYSASKYIAELITQSYHNSYFSGVDSNIQVCTVRSGNLIGGGDWGNNRIVPDCMRAWSQDKPITIANPSATRPWQYVLDVLNGYLTAGQYLSQDPSLNGKFFNFGPDYPQDYSIQELIEELSKHWTFSQDVQPYTGSEPSPNNKEVYQKLDWSHTNKIIQWTPFLSFEESSKLTSRWYYEYYKKGKSAYSLISNQIEDFQCRFLQ